MKLSGQPFEILVLLLEQPGKIVTREQLRAHLWPADTFVDFEHGLNTAVKKLRAALGDSPENSRYIETVPRVGYRFVAPVEEVSASGQPEADAGLASSRSGKPATVVQPAKRRWPVVLGVSAVLVAALGASFEWSRSRVRPQPTSGRLMVAVLPFENLTGDAVQDYFSDGLTEEMIAQLGRLDPEHLGVMARTSVMRYKHGQQQLDQVSRELGVQYVLEGSVRRDSHKVRITAQLVQMRDQTRVWARQYDRELSSVLALQGEIAQEIADEIQVTLADNHKLIGHARQLPLSPKAYEAYDLYLKGLYFWNKRTVEGFQRAIDYFQQAIAKNPNDARAHAGLADSYALIGGYSGIQDAEYTRKARAAALRALEIDDNLPEAHTALALIVQNYDWDWQLAEKEFRRAMELNPNYATAYHWYAEHLMWLGRFDEALQESERARQLDPLSLIIAADNGAILYYSRQYDRAIKQFHSVLDLDPNFQRAGLIKAAYIHKGMYTEAMAALDEEPPSEPATWYWSQLAYIYGRSGRHVEAQHALEKALEANRRRQMDASYLVEAYIGVGNNNQALTWLEWAAAHQPNALTSLKVDPTYDPLRSDPRFQELLHRLRFPP